MKKRLCCHTQPSSQLNDAQKMLAFLTFLLICIISTRRHCPLSTNQAQLHVTQLFKWKGSPMLFSLLIILVRLILLYGLKGKP